MNVSTSMVVYGYAASQLAAMIAALTTIGGSGQVVIGSGARVRRVYRNGATSSSES
jgi:hypothetical protein